MMLSCDERRPLLPTEKGPRYAVLRFAAALRLRLRVQVRAAPGGSDRHEGRACRAASRARTSPTMINRCANDDDNTADLSPTAHLLDELQLYGHRPFKNEPDPRPLPDPEQLQGALADIFDALVATLSDTRLEPDLPDLLWSAVNLFHRRIERIERALDANECDQRRSQRDQDGSEIRSVELERLIAQGLTLIERRNSFEFMRDAAIQLYEMHTGEAWRPRCSSLVSRRTLTAAMIDSRDFLQARRRAEAEVLLPKGSKIAFAGGASAMIITASGRRSTACTRSTLTWCCCTAAVRAAPRKSPRAGRTCAKFRKSCSSRTGPGTPRRRRLSATTSCLNACRSALSSFQAPASPITSPTKPASSASRSSISARAAPRERRLGERTQVECVRSLP